MAKKWKVFRGNRFVATYTSAQIRQALREGLLDPFDRVAAPGSSHMRELVEVDEIFQIEGEAALTPQTPSPAAAPAPHASINLAATAAPPPPEPAPSAPLREIQPVRQPAAMTAPPPRAQASSRPPSPKRPSRKAFYIHDPSGKRLGPVSAREVLSLYGKGYLSSKVLVEQRGSAKRIPIKRFAKAYGGKGKPLPKKGADLKALIRNHNAISLRKTEALRNAAPAPGGGGWGKLWFQSSLVIALLGVAAALVLPPAPQAPDRAPRANPAPTSEHKAPPDPSRAAPPHRDPTPPAPAIAQPHRAPLTRPSPEPQADSRPPPSQPAPQPLPMPAKRPPPKPPPTRPPAPLQPSNYLVALDGATVITAPAPIDHARLDACKLKCRLPFRDRKGGVFTAVFFKGPYQNLLKAKRTVRVSGTVQAAAGQVIIYVQGFQ